MGALRAIAAAGGELRDVARASTPTHLHLRDRLVAVVLITLIVDAVGSTVIFFAERGAHQTEIHTFGSAAFWTTCQLLTVSSQLANPISTIGRIADVVLEAYAITVVATLAGSFGAFFHRRGLERHPLAERP